MSHVTQDTIFKVNLQGGGGILWWPPAQLVIEKQLQALAECLCSG